MKGNKMFKRTLAVLAVAGLAVFSVAPAAMAAEPRDTGCVFSGGGWICFGEIPPTVEPPVPAPAPAPAPEVVEPAPVPAPAPKPVVPAPAPAPAPAPIEVPEEELPAC